jgi:GNAT superfamily N-acetyltransferase
VARHLAVLVGPGRSLSEDPTANYNGVMIDVTEATARHIPGIFHVRVSVRENVLNEQQLRERGITPEAVAAALDSHCKAWVAESNGDVVGFSIANRKTDSIWALFVLPEYEGQGLGRRLMEPAVAWLWASGAERIWLTTGPTTRAACFYRHLGWQEAGMTEHGEIRFELERPWV